MGDKHFLKLAVEESLKSVGPHKFGALIVKDNEILAIDYNRVRENSDPSAHAEISAIRSACDKLRVFNLPSGCTLFASHEPCLMCFSCAAWAQIDRIVFASPASDLTGDMYEFKDVSIFDMAKKLARPMKVERVGLDSAA